MIPIKNYEGLYLIHTNGDIFSLDRKILGRDGTLYPFKGKKRKPGINKQTGYVQIDLWKNNIGTKFAVHRLVAEHFIPNPLNRPEVNHKDSNRQNPSKDNLEWVTSQENSLHGYATGVNTQHYKRKLVEAEYKEIFSRFLSGESFGNILLDYPISPGRLSVNLRTLINKWGRMEEYVAERHKQRSNRGGSNAH